MLNNIDIFIVNRIQSLISNYLHFKLAPSALDMVVPLEMGQDHNFHVTQAIHGLQVALS